MAFHNSEKGRQLLTDYLTDLVKRESSRPQCDLKLMDAAVEQLIRTTGNSDVVTVTARLLARNFIETENICMTFQVEHQLQWPLKIDKNRNTKRSYQTGFIENEGEFWSFMVEIGSDDGVRKTAKPESWFKFYVIK
jgi:hypothetical protein